MDSPTHPDTTDVDAALQTVLDAADGMIQLFYIGNHDEARRISQALDGCLVRSEIRGCRLMLDLSDIMQARIALTNTWEPEVLKLWEMAVSDAQTIFDVGAAIGVFSVLAKHSAPDAQIYCFEPQEQYRDAIARNFEINEFDLPHISEYAISSGSQETTLSFDPMEPAGAQLREAGESDVSRTVQCIDLKGATQASGCSKIDVLKLDIEGAERDVLLNDDGFIHPQRVATLFVEFHDIRTYRPRVLAAMHKAGELGYNVHIIRDNLENYDPEMVLRDHESVLFTTFYTPWIERVTLS